MTGTRTLPPSSTRPSGRISNRRGRSGMECRRLSQREPHGTTGMDWTSLLASPLTVLNPTLVFGPVLSDVDHGCATILARMMKRTTNLAQPKVSLGLVDVRDVAEAHVRCLERPETDGERILVTASPSAWYADIARWLNQEFGRYDYGISTWECPNWLLKIYAASGLDPQSKAVVRRRGSELRFDNTKSIRLLDMKYRSVGQGSG
ncbi:hypothetical protein PENTCL1PPCAC_30320 [Pristionchus entomophagus]|uniref:Uncharacterized protein n=1 Tax=Pristionchus entomophagus TaxID=358040 RepID=A0AAV5UM27_9BILA|nr:hypothetical protein PENTCL1PPCAC_30320 [Pristionchus entomophagus]